MDIYLLKKGTRSQYYYLKYYDKSDQKAVKLKVNSELH